MIEASAIRAGDAPYGSSDRRRCRPGRAVARLHVTHVHAAGEADPAVDHHDLAMGAEVDVGSRFAIARMALSSTSVCTLTIAQEVKAAPVCRDPDADELLALAMAAQADLIIHSDAKLKT